MTIDPTEFGLPADAGKLPSPRRSLWRGPCDDSENGGVTCELLTRFLDCPERTRLRYVEGLVPEPRLDHKKVFARLFAAAKREYDARGNVAAALDAAYDECDDLHRQYPGPEATALTDHWFNVLVPTFQGYVRHRQENDIDQGATRSVRRLPAYPVGWSYKHTLPSGRVVVCRGPDTPSWAVGVGPSTHYRLSRRVVKGDLDPDRLRNTARFDLDTMFEVAMCQKSDQVREVYYDLVRRPLSGGKGSIKRNKPTAKNPEGESATAFYSRLRDTVLDVDPGYWYPHFLVTLEPSDVDRFRRECLDPALERLCDWYENDVVDVRPERRTHHTAPFTLDRSRTEYDEYLLTGSERGLVRSQVAFPELENE